MTKDHLLSQTINCLRFPLTVAVVFIHFNISRKGISVHGINYGLENPEWYSFVINFISVVFAGIAVPLFFFISGFLFFYKKEEFSADIYKQKLKTRARTLLLPFILWNVIAVIYELIKMLPFLSPIFPGAYITEVHLSLTRILNTFFNCTATNGIIVTPIQYEITEMANEPYPMNAPMWYVRDLMVMVLLTPLVYRLIKRTGFWIICVLGFIWFFIKQLVPDSGYIVHLSIAAFFFSWGAYFSISKKDFIETMRQFKYAPYLYLPIAIIDSFTLNTSYNYCIHYIGILVGIASLIVIASNLTEQKNVKANAVLAGSSFFVYAMHKLIIDDVAKIVFSVLHLPDNTYVMTTFYFLIPIVTVAICVSLYILLKRYMPALCSLLSGGR